MVLAHLLRWLKGRGEISFDVVAMRSGPLEGLYRELASRLILLDTGWPQAATETVVAARELRLRERRWALRALGKGAAGIHRWVVGRAVPDLARYDCIYLNSIVSAGVFPFLPRRRPPVVCHVHELDYALRHGLDPATLSMMLDRTDRFVACSEAVRANLVEGHGVPSERVEMCHEFIPVRAFADAGHAHDRAEVLAELGVPSDAFVVGSAGTRDWRKGTDLFLQVAAELRRRCPGRDFRFLWVGGDDAWPAHGSVAHDLHQLGLSKWVRFVDSTPEPERYFGAFDAFALTSREDPFPLACLEAAALGKPIVGFSCGGIGEVLRDDAGIIVGYADVHAMTSTFERLASDPELRRKLGRCAAERVASECDVDVGAPRIMEIVSRLVRSSRQRG